MNKILSNKVCGLFTGLIEVWKDIEGFEGHYQVSSFGRVKSMARFRDGRNGAKVPLKEKILAQKTSKGGYKIVGLCKDAKKYHPSVHRLVASAFSVNSENKPTVNHIDGDKTNNNIRNLEWSSHSEQMLHAFKLELLEKRGSPKYTKAFKRSILDYKLNNPDVSTKKISELFNVSETTARRIINKGVAPRVTGCMTKNGLVYKAVRSNADVAKMKELRASGMTLQQIGDIYNLGTSQVWRICKNLSRNNTFED